LGEPAENLLVLLEALLEPLLEVLIGSSSRDVIVDCLPYCFRHWDVIGSGDSRQLRSLVLRQAKTHRLGSHVPLLSVGAPLLLVYRWCLLDGLLDGGALSTDFTNRLIYRFA
jgi:hypothetical protein